MPIKVVYQTLPKICTDREKSTRVSIMSEQQKNQYFNDYYYDPSLKMYRPGEGPGRYYRPGDPRCSYYCDAPIDRSHRFKVESVEDDVSTVPGHSELGPGDSVSQHGRRSRGEGLEDRGPARQRERSVSVPGPRSSHPSPPLARDDCSVPRQELRHESSPPRAQKRRNSDLDHRERRSQHPPSSYHMNDTASTYQAPDLANETRDPLADRYRRSQTDGTESDSSRRRTCEGERRRNTGERRRGSAERRRRVRAEHPIMSWFAGSSEWR